MNDRATSTGPLPAGGQDIVLVVDDSPDALRMLTDAIEMTGATVLVALGGAQALEIAGRLTPDIVLMDAVMPGMDGFEATRRFKADPALRHVPVIFMTGLSETGHVVQGLETGAVDYLMKPIVPDELIARIRVHLANARETASAREALDTAGRFLLAADGDGRILWATPQARRLLAAVLGDAGASLPGDLCAALRTDAAGGFRPLPPATGYAGPPAHLSFLGTMGEAEHLFRVSLDEAVDREGALQRRFGLTQREGEVSLWLARGKANRDIADILDLSPRTVNKHLQTIFAKLGVENRASAAVLVLKTLADD
ncbi:DNA-binding response regulator [Aureimonas mangrovi]|uniref:DNA-binding response regulator n=1 Tax=Aureimonas mangrovi TaxID=2758041 RepID=UPI002483FD95|nr:DNA-binding response regulator [Aureimonas mangrovi]